MRSERMSRVTLPTSGTRPQVMGEVQRAAWLATRPEALGRCGCVEGKRWRVICGERISGGRGEASRVGRRDWRTRRAVEED